MLLQSKNKVSDAIFHLETLKTDFIKLKIDYNRNSNLVYIFEKFIHTCELIIELIKRYDNKNLKSLSSKINNLLLKDDELHGIQILIKKTQKLENFDYSKTAYLIFEI